VAQMMACLGQTAIEGKCNPYGFVITIARNPRIIESSFIRGLTPHHLILPGREGLIDAAVTTADTGFIQRQLTKFMEEI
jgi:DNA-directed RNA polymerase beta' subunit